MRLIWEIEPEDIAGVKSFLALHRSDLFVQHRIEKNLRPDKPEVSRDEFWQRMVSCLLTSQQRSGPGSAVNRFTSTVPFPLSYPLCKSQRNVRTFSKEVLTSFGGIRYWNRIADHVAHNLRQLERGLWHDTMSVLDDLRRSQTVETEQRAAGFIDEHLKGFGPKQSRNLLQSLGLTRYEIPIDSRITRWLNEFGFPVRLSAKALADANYYRFVSEGIQQLCARCGEYPCVLDAAIFTSYDKGGGHETTLVGSSP